MYGKAQYLVCNLNISFILFFTFFRMFAVTKCGRCHAGISANELVMRARDLVYHLHCFSCTSCGVPLAKGDHFGMRDGYIYCRWVLLSFGEKNEMILVFMFISFWFFIILLYHVFKALLVFVFPGRTTNCWIFAILQIRWTWCSEVANHPDITQPHPLSTTKVGRGKGKLE